MKKLTVFLSLIFLSSAAFAETVHFKDGRSVTGKVVEQDASQVQVDLNGMTMTYFVDEIKDIDGKPIAPAAAPAENKTPEITATQIPLVSSGPKSETVAKENPAEKKALILKFIDVFGTRKAMKNNFDAMQATLVQQKPQDAAKIKEKFNVDEVIDRLVPLYDKYFTTEDLKAYIDFYSSEKGQKLISSIGFIMKDSVQVGEAYLREKFPELDEKK
jgi:hypothetical protein